MLYLANPTTEAVRIVMRSGELGCITSPAQASVIPAGVAWAADNGRFGNGWPGYWRWGRWLRAQPRQGCLFAVAPDVPFDAAATLRQAEPALRFIRRLGYPAALAAQNGLEDMAVPWDAFDVLFLGGDTEWKLGSGARRLTRQAAARGMWVHMGRVNSRKRYRY